MTLRLQQSDGVRLDLPGRISTEFVSGSCGSRITFRAVEIPVPRSGEPLRGPHCHHGYEECMYVLNGTGVTVTESGDFPIVPGDIVLVPAEEKHVTRNTGTGPLVLLCFFPAPDVGSTTENFACF